MRINKFVALATGLSRRGADSAITQGRVLLDGQPAALGSVVAAGQTVSLDGKNLTLPEATMTLILHKPSGYVVSRRGQGSQTIYDLLPPELHDLKPVGRLDKDSSGLLLLTNDGQLAQELTHPSRQKSKVYEVALDKPLAPLHHQMINDIGVTLADGVSRLQLTRLIEGNDNQWQITMHEGRNRQIRRTFAALGYTVTHLHRTRFGNYRLAGLPVGEFRKL